MVRLSMEGIVPMGLRDVWRLLWLHLDENTVRAIHPWMLSGRVVGDEGQGSYADLTFPARHVVEREVRVARRALQNTWTYRIAPPTMFAYEIRGSEGFASTITNTYTEVPGGTRIVTEGLLGIGRVPGFLQRPVVGRLLERADREDLAYLRLHGFRTVTETARPKGT